MGPKEVIRLKKNELPNKIWTSSNILTFCIIPKYEKIEIDIQ